MDSVLTAKKKIDRLRDKKGRFLKEEKEYVQKFLPISRIYETTSIPDDGIILIAKTVDVPFISCDNFVFYPPMPAQKLKNTKMLISSIMRYTHYMNVKMNYLSEELFTQNMYFPLSFEFEIVFKNHPEYKELMESKEKVLISNLDRTLKHSFFISSGVSLLAEDKTGKCIPAYKFLSSKANRELSSKNYGGHGQNTLFHSSNGGFIATAETSNYKCLGYHMDSVASGIYGINEKLKKNFPDAKLSTKSLMDVSPDEESEKILDKKAPLNIYGLKKNPSNKVVVVVPAAINFHFGHSPSKKRITSMVKAIDAICAVSCVSLFQDFDTKEVREHILPGDYDVVGTNVSYLALTNARLIHPIVTNLVIDLSRKALVFGDKGLFKYWKATEEETLSCILSCDVSLSHSILERNKELFLNILSASYYDLKKGVSSSETNRENMFSSFIKGINSFIKDPYDFHMNWYLEGKWHSHFGGMSEPNVSYLIREKRKDPKIKIGRSHD